MEDKEVIAWGKLIDKVAHGTARDFPDSNIEDLQQALWVALLEAQQKGHLITIDEQYAESALWYAAKTSAWSERKQHLTITPQYGYRTSDVRQLLENFFDREEWVGTWSPEDAESELGDVGLEMQTDLSRAWDRLKTPQKVTIYYHFGLKETVDSKKLSRAIARMADILNTYQPQRRPNGPGRRTVISNAHANYLISNTIEE